MAAIILSEAAEFASLGKSFLEGARVLDEAQLNNARILLRPILALAGQGLELILKACFHLNGQAPPHKGNTGHQILALWSADICEPLRGHFFANASVVAEMYRNSCHYRGVPHDDEVLPSIEHSVTELCKLHGRDRYPLRYPTDQGQLAPRTPFLVKSLWRTADDLVKRPKEFELRRFCGNA